MQAFQGDVALKARMTESVRARWAANELLPASILKWQPDQKIVSLCAAMVESQDGDVFQQRTGIPLELAMLCEALIAVGVDLRPDETQPGGFVMRGAPSILSFGMEWLDAIPPGADLSVVVPRFMAQVVEMVLKPDFAVAEHIVPDVRDAASRVLELWKLELLGRAVEAKDWRSVRMAAVMASEACNTPWCFPIAAFVEALAWPVHTVAAEFVSLFQTFLVNWMNYLERPFLSEEDRANQLHALIGWQAIARAERDAAQDEAAMQALLDTMPDSKRALMAVGDPIVRERVREAKARAREATVPVLRGQMDCVLKLIAAA
jgi:hypothetical protein